MNKTHYVYLSYENGGRKYIGSRTCYDCTPEEDPYLGSYKDKTFEPTQKEILAVCKTREHANLIEAYLHQTFNVSHNDEYANRTSNCACYAIFGWNPTIFKNCRNTCPIQSLT